MPRLTNSDYLRIRHFLIHLWDQDDGDDLITLPSYAQRDLHDYFAPTVDMPDRDAVVHRKRMKKDFPSLPQSAGRAFEGRPNLLVDRHLKAVTRVHKVGRRQQSIRVLGVSRPKIDTHYLAKALLQLVREDDGTLMKKARKLRARAEKK
jgi:UDP-N-acetylmuramyl pentapeptide synthase